MRKFLLTLAILSISWTARTQTIGAGVKLGAGVTINPPYNLSTPFELRVNYTGSGTGTVTSSPSGINCGSTCSYFFSTGTSVTLTASAATGSSFSGWSGGGCSGTGTCTVTVNSNISVTATFAPSSSGIVFNPSPGSYGSTQYVGITYPTNPNATLFYTVGPLCPMTGNCPVGDTVIGPASTWYVGPSCVSGCSSGNGGYGTAISAPVSGAGTTINVYPALTAVTMQNNLSSTNSQPASWFPSHWKYIAPVSSGLKTPTSGSGCNGSCTGNVLAAQGVTQCNTCGVGSLGTIVDAWVIPGKTAPVTPPNDPTTGSAASVTYIGYTSSSQNTSGYGHPQILYTGKNELNCGASTFCTWIAQDFWVLADGGPVAAWESDMQIWDSKGAWTMALQCRVHGNASPLTAGWGYGSQSSGLTQISGTTAANCPSTSEWLHVMYYGTRNQSAGTFTIVSLTLQSAPGGPAGSTGYAVFPVNKTFSVDTGQTGNSCTNQMQIDAWCNGSNCSATQESGAYYALNNVSCGIGTPPVISTTTGLFN